MNVHRRLQERFVRGDDLALASCPDALMLEVLVGVLAADARRRRRTPRIAGTLFVGSAAAIGLMVWFSLSGLFIVFPLAFFLMALGVATLFASSEGAGPKALLTIRAPLLPRATPEMVPALLDLCDTLGGDLFTDPESLERQTEAEVHDALTRLLPRFHDAPALTETQRRALRNLARWYESAAPDRTVAALLVLAETGDRSLVGHARRWRRWHHDEKLSTAAGEYLRVVETHP